MAFPSGFVNDIERVGPGERAGHVNIELATTSFEDGLVIGRFAKLATGSIDNMDGSATPTVAGLVMRHAARAVEDGDTVDQDLYGQAEYMVFGLGTVEVVDGDTPTQFGDVFAHNLADADAGKATTTDSADTVATGAKWIREVKPNVWLIFVK